MSNLDPRTDACKFYGDEGNQETATICASDKGCGGHLAQLTMAGLQLGFSCAVNLLTHAIWVWPKEPG